MGGKGSGRPRKSTQELALSGAFAKDPKRKLARVNEPLPNGPLGEPPRFFDDTQRDLWREVEEIVPVGVLTTADRLVVETIVLLLQKQREGFISGSERNILVGCYARLGLTPADRSRVAVPTEKDEDGEQDDFATFAKRHAPASTRTH